MNKIILLLTLLGLSLQAVEIPTEHAKQRSFSSFVKLNAQIIQLSNASQSIMSTVGGHIEKYYVKSGESVKKGQKLVLMESIIISKMTAEYLSLKKQFIAQKKNYDAMRKLYKKGMTSMSSLNNQSIKKDELQAKLTALKSQLTTLNINTKNLKVASSNFVLYAHSDGVVSAILQPLHSSVKDETPIISLVKDQAYYLKSFLPLSYASKVKIGQKVVMKKDDKNVIAHITQILPKVDETTQRIVLLSSIDEPVEGLYLNAYTEVTLYFDADKSFVAVKKSGLSFFNNEWVVFVEKEHNEHEEHGHDKLEEEHGQEEEHEEHEEEAEAPYEVRVIEIVAQDESFVGVKGLEVGEEYVSDKSYFVKSMMLKSSLGGHGH